MKLSYYFFFALIICFLGFSSCGGGSDDDGGNCNYNWAVGVQDEAAAIVSAAAALSSDPSTANCNNYKSAIQAYINKLRPYGDCALLTGSNRTDFQDALDQWEDSLGDVDCTP